MNDVAQRHYKQNLGNIISVELFRPKKIFYLDVSNLWAGSLAALNGVNISQASRVSNNTIFKSPNDKEFARILQECL